MGHILRTHTHTHSAKLVVRIKEGHVIAFLFVLLSVCEFVCLCVSPSHPFVKENLDSCGH